MSTGSDCICVGDYVSLYCEEVEGYVYNSQSSSEHNSVFVFQWQDRETPSNIPNPQVVQLQVCIQNRYKLNKIYRRLLAQQLDTDEHKRALEQAKIAADAENDDNKAEMKRQIGKRVKYGEIIQFLHAFTGKYVHVSTTHTSRKDKNNMQVYLQNFNAKHAQFKLLPRYKVKSEGESVQVLDQIILESFKSPGQYFHVSSSWKIDHFSVGSELNLGIKPAGFTIIKCSKYLPSVETTVRGGSIIRLFHKELEAYVVAEGLFDDEITDDVHLRIRIIDQLIPKTLYPSTSANTYWQVEAESSILNAEPIRWEQQIRLRHMTTRMYLCITSDRRVQLNTDCNDPRTVFRLHPVIRDSEDVTFDSYARIEHVITGYWLHALRDEEYIRRQFREKHNETLESMTSLKWDGADLRKISASGEKVYHDAYTIQLVENNLIESFNYVSGMVLFLLNFIKDREELKILNTRKTYRIVVALFELKKFIADDKARLKDHQKLLRNLRVIDLLVRVLKCKLQGSTDQTNLTKVFKAAYEVLYSYMIGSSKKNALYFAKYINFFQTQIRVQLSDIGLNVARMLVELIRDNRKIVDRITQEQIAMFVSLLKYNRNYRYLNLLSVLCVCDGVAIPKNQEYITEHWLRRDTTGMRFLTERGQNVNGQPNVIYLSVNNGVSWQPLHQFIDKDINATYDEEEALFFEHQLELYGKISYGRNDFSIFVITRELGILPWDEVFLSLTSNLLPDKLKAKYCYLIIVLFIDVGTNYSILDYTNLSFIYEDVAITKKVVDKEQTFIKKQVPLMDNWLAPEGVIKDLVPLFPVIRDWISEYLETNKDMTASKADHNMLTEQVLALFHFLVKYGYYASDDINKLIRPLINLLNGFKDVPFLPLDVERGYNRDGQKLVNIYREKDRYERNDQTEAIVNAKYQALDVLDLLLTFQFNTRLECFISKFKGAMESFKKKSKNPSVLTPLLEEDFQIQKRNANLQKLALKELKQMFDSTAYFSSDEITTILMDLTNYKYDKLVNKALVLLNKYYQGKTKLFKMGVQATVLITNDSCLVHREVSRTMPILRRFSRSRLNDGQVASLGPVLDRYTEYCHFPKDENERNPINQNVLINHEVLSLLFDMLSIEFDKKLLEQYKNAEIILKKCLQLLRALSKNNYVVQEKVFGKLDVLLRVNCVENEMAVALAEAFNSNQVTCLKILPQQIHYIVTLAAQHLENVPEYLDLLNSIVKVEDLGVTLKRNQAYVMKFLMQDYAKLASLMDQSREYREDILKIKMGENLMRYFVSFIDLLAACAEGENLFIESMCQTIMSMEEIITICSNDDISENLRKPFLKYFLWVYMKSSSSESGVTEYLCEDSFWRFLNQLSLELNEISEFISKNPEGYVYMFRNIPNKWEIAAHGDNLNKMRLRLYYIFDIVLAFIQTYYSKYYIIDKNSEGYYAEVTNKLGRSIVGFCDVVVPLINATNHYKSIIGCITAIIPISAVPNATLERIMEDLRRSNKSRETKQRLHSGQREYYQVELDLNSRLRTFAVNCSLIYNGENTVQAQLKHPSNRTYTDIGADDGLPLGEEFQQHLALFYKQKERRANKKLELVIKLVSQLDISTHIFSKLKSETKRLEQEDLDVRTMQLMRAIIHNEERRLPEDWEERAADFKKEVSMIRSIQNELNGMGAVVKILPHLARSSDAIAKEVLSFLSIMLLHANENVQGSLLHYFLHTREESFFAAVRNKMQLSALAIKEQRALVVQFRARAKELLAQSRSLQSSLIVGKQVISEIQQVDSYLKSSKIGDRRKVSLAVLQKNASERAAKNITSTADSKISQNQSKSNGILPMGKPEKSKRKKKKVPTATLR